MEDTPANYNQQNQMYEDDTIKSPRNDELEQLQAEIDLALDYGDEDLSIGMPFDDQYGSLPQLSSGFDLMQKRKMKKKKMHKVSSKWENPNIREVLMAGAYGGVAKKKQVRNGVINTHDIYQGLHDIPIPNGGRLVGADMNSNKSSRNSLYKRDSSVLRLKDQLKRIDSGSNLNFASKKRLSKNNSIAFKASAIRAAGVSLLDPQQRGGGTQLYEKKSRDYLIKKNNLLRKTGQQRLSQQSKDKDFEKLFGQDIDEFLDNSKWDVNSEGHMSQLSQGTIKSSKRLRGLEDIYLKRIDSQKDMPMIKSKLNKGFRGGNIPEMQKTANNNSV